MIDVTNTAIDLVAAMRHQQDRLMRSQSDAIHCYRAAKRRGWELRLTARVDGDGIQAPGYVVLCVDPASRFGAWRVHFWNAQDGGFHGGSYHDTVVEGAEAFAVRCVKCGANQ